MAGIRPARRPSQEVRIFGPSALPGSYGMYQVGKSQERHKFQAVPGLRNPYFICKVYHIPKRGYGVYRAELEHYFLI